MEDTAFKKFENKVKPENRNFVNKNLNIIEKINKILESHKNIKTKKDLAIALNIEESKIYDMLNGLYDLRISEITQIETILNESIIDINEKLYIYKLIYYNENIEDFIIYLNNTKYFNNFDDIIIDCYYEIFNKCKNSYHDIYKITAKDLTFEVIQLLKNKYNFEMLNSDYEFIISNNDCILGTLSTTSFYSNIKIQEKITKIKLVSI